MKCMLDKVKTLNGKNRRSIDIIDIDTKKRQVLLVCSDCNDKIAAMKSEADKKAADSQNAQGAIAFS